MSGCVIALTAVAVAKAFAVGTQLHLSTAVALTYSRLLFCPYPLVYVRRSNSLHLTTEAALIVFLSSRV